MLTKKEYQQCKKLVIEEYNGKKITNYKEMNHLVKTKASKKQSKQLFTIQRRLRYFRFMKNNRQFKQYFGFNMPFDAMIFTFTNSYMLNIIKLDELLATPKNVSLKDHIKNVYGNEACEFIQSLINRGQ